MTTIDKIKREQLTKKCERLCKLYKCGVIDLMILSIQVHAQNKNNNIEVIDNGKKRNSYN